MTHAEAIETIIDTLERVQIEPTLFMQGGDLPEVVDGYINGFEFACQELGYIYKTYEVVIAQRGWKRFDDRVELLSQKTGENMKEGGMSDAEIIHELFAISIDCWKITRDGLQPEQQ